MNAKKDKGLSWQKPNIIITVILATVMALALCIFAGKIMEYNELKKEKDAIGKSIDDCVEEIGALEHEYDAEMDDAYIESVAKSKLGLVSPDEIIVYDD